MISLERYQLIRERHGQYASWAVWAEQGEMPKDNIADLSVLDPALHPNLLAQLRPDIVFLGLNISRRISEPFGNFHDPRPMATDFKIRAALLGTPYWGGYMTDLIKDFEQKVAGEVVSYLNAHRGVEEENIRILRAELRDLGEDSFTLIAFGRDAERIAKRNLGDEFRVIGVPHYAKYASMGDYRAQVHEALFREERGH